jgi:hypothetical protein
MNRIALLTLALAAAGASTAVLAQSAPVHHAPPEGQGHRHGKGVAGLDANQDGRISRAEIPADGRGARLAQGFAAIDANKDGFLVRSELQAWREAHHDARKVERTQEWTQRFDAADLNHDGKLSKVEASENMPRLQPSFAWFDDNRAGFLSREELKRR